MKVDLKASWVMEFTSAEFNLISRALRSILREEEADKALKLQREMMEQKVRSFDVYANEMNKLKKNLETSTDNSE